MRGIGLIYRIKAHSLMDHATSKYLRDILAINDLNRNCVCSFVIIYGLDYICIIFIHFWAH